MKPAVRDLLQMTNGERARARAFLWLMEGNLAGKRPDYFAGARSAYQGKPEVERCRLDRPGTIDGSEYCAGARAYWDRVADEGDPR